MAGFVVIWIVCYAVAVSVYVVHAAANHKPGPARPRKRAPPNVPPAPSKGEIATSARHQFQQDLKMIDGMPLDDDERDAAREKAKQVLLTKLKQNLG
jgi:hypothetical protein